MLYLSVCACVYVSYVLVVEASNDRATRATNKTKEAFEKIEDLQSRENKLSKLVVSTKKALSRKGKKEQSSQAEMKRLRHELQMAQQEGAKEVASSEADRKQEGHVQKLLAEAMTAMHQTNKILALQSSGNFAMSVPHLELVLSNKLKSASPASPAEIVPTPEIIRRQRLEELKSLFADGLITDGVYKDGIAKVLDY